MGGRNRDRRRLDQDQTAYSEGRAKGATGSEIRFSYQPDGTIDADQCRYGIILVRYHNTPATTDLRPSGLRSRPNRGRCQMALFQSLLQRHGSEVAVRGGVAVPLRQFRPAHRRDQQRIRQFKDHATTEFDLAPLESKKKGHGRGSREKRRSRTGPALRKDSATAKRPSTAIPTAM